MKKYETYKDSGVKWIGEIPENWKSVKIKFITDIYTGNSLNSDLKILFESENENDLPYVSTKDVDIDNNTLNYNNGLRIPLDNSYYKVAPEGSFLLCIEGANAGKKMAYVEQDCCFVNKLACFNFPNKFLFYFAQSNSFKTQFFNSISGLIGGVSISVLKEFVSTIPSPKEQTQIAAYLDHKTDLIDAIIAQKEALIKKLKEQRQAIINDAVTKGLNKNVKLKDSGIEWLGEIPEHWEVIKLFGLCYLVRGNSSFKKDELLSNGTYVALQYGKTYKVNEVNEKYKFYVNDEFYKESQIVNYGDTIIISTSETIEDLGHSVFYNRKDLGLLGGEQLLLKAKNNKINPKYLFYSTKVFLKDLRKNATGVKVYRFNIHDLKNVFTPVPSILEQNLIVKHIETKSTTIDKVIIRSQTSIQKLKEYRQSIISEAVTGKIDVRDWQAPKS
jgi:type I restriction enzyme S subunit